MKVNPIGSGLMTNNVNQAQESTKVFECTSQKKEPVAVKVSISEEGKENYRNSKMTQNEELNNVIERRNELLSGKNVPQIDFNYELGNRLTTYKGDSQYNSTEEKAKDLLNAYATLYDEIVTGYENNMRERYIEDNTSENGYRRLTLEDEIEGLNTAYKKYADFLEVQSKQSRDVAQIFDEYNEKLSQIGSERAELANKAKDAYAKVKEEKLPENISEKMVDASKQFVEQYMKPIYKTSSIQDILKNVSIWSKKAD